MIFDCLHVPFNKQCCNWLKKYVIRSSKHFQASFWQKYYEREVVITFKQFYGSTEKDRNFLYSYTHTIHMYTHNIWDVSQE